MTDEQQQQADVEMKEPKDVEDKQEGGDEAMPETEPKVSETPVPVEEEQHTEMS